MLEEQIKDIKPDFVHKITHRFIIDNDTAVRWITEYFIYLSLMMTQSEPSSKTDCKLGQVMPSHIISEVWKAHYEFFENYVEVTAKLFGGVHIYPGQYCPPYIYSDSSLEKYSQTLKRYEEVTGAKPEPQIWTPLENFKYNRCDLIEKIQTIEEGKATGMELEEFRSYHAQYISVNIHRLVLSQGVLNYDFYQQEDQLKKIQSLTLHPTKEVGGSQKLDKLKKVPDQDLKYLWRELYPHCSNIFVDKAPGEKMSSYTIKFFEEDFPKIDEKFESNIFNKEGIIFVSDEYSNKICSPIELKKDLQEGIRQYWDDKDKLDDIDDLCNNIYHRFSLAKYRESEHFLHETTNDEIS